MRFSLFPLAFAVGCAASHIGRVPAGSHDDSTTTTASGDSVSVAACYDVEIGKNLSLAMALDNVARRGTMTGDLDADRAYLFNWFGKDIGPGSDIYDAAQNSPAF